MSLAELDFQSLERRLPTGVRHRVVLVTVLTSVLLYLDRFCMNYAQRYVQEDLGLTRREFGWCMSAFFFSYALAQVPSGWLTDRFGSRLMLSWYILVWSFFTVATGWATGLIMLLVARLATGLGQAGAYPTAAAVIGHWIPLSGRGLASSLVGMGGRLGAAIAPILTAYLAILFVPLSTPVELDEQDVLDSRLLAGAIVAGEQPPEVDGSRPMVEETAKLILAHRVWSELDEPARNAARALAPPAGAEKYELFEQPPPAAGASDVRDLVAGLNAAMQRLNVDKAPELALLPLEREATRLIESEEPLSSAERLRLNRFILEAVYFDGVRKLYGQGWRPVMYVFGLAGLLVAAIYYFVVRDRPEQHPSVNEAELALIQSGRLATASDAAPRTVGPPPMRSIVTSPSMWLVSIVQFATNIGWAFLVTWLPAYLLDVHRLPFEERGLMAAVPMAVGWAGALMGGWWTDRFVLRWGLRWGRAFPISFSRFLAMAAFLWLLFEPSPWTATLLFALVAFGTDLGSPAVWAYSQDVGGRYVASALGWGNMWGNLGAFVSPILLEVIVSRSDGSWNPAFLTCAAAFLIAGVCGMFIDARQPIDAG